MQIKHVWPGLTVEAPDDVEEVLKTYREYPPVKQGTTKEMLSKRWSSKPKPKAESQGAEASKKKKGKGKGKERKGKGSANVDSKESAKGKGRAQDADMKTEEVKRNPVSGSTADTEKDDDGRKFACRHCHNLRVLSGIRAANEKAGAPDPDSPTGISDAAEAGGSGAWGGGDSIWGDRSGSAPSSKPPVWMEWNGMRSHLKAKYVS